MGRSYDEPSRTATDFFGHSYARAVRSSPRGVPNAPDRGARRRARSLSVERRAQHGAPPSPWVTRGNLAQRPASGHRGVLWDRDLVRSERWGARRPRARVDSLGKDELRKQQKPYEPGRVVAELKLGFWVSLLSTNYEQRLWPKLLPTVFPYLPRSKRTRSTVAGRFQEIRRLRNRVSHHEPIYRSKTLAQHYRNIEEAIGWMVPPLLSLLPIGEGFSAIFERGPDVFVG